MLYEIIFLEYLEECLKDPFNLIHFNGLGEGACFTVVGGGLDQCHTIKATPFLGDSLLEWDV